MNLELFETDDSQAPQHEIIANDTHLLRGFFTTNESAVLSAVHNVAQQAPFRHMITPGGFKMSVAMTNCGSYGWVTDRTGYRYTETDPHTAQPWPQMPEVLQSLAHRAAAATGFPEFVPDACLINRYDVGAKMSLHQDKNEQDFTQPIVSVSLGVPAVFLFGGLSRSDRPLRVRLSHGDIVIWGGTARLRFHGILPLKQSWHPLVGSHRINLTFRKAR